MAFMIWVDKYLKMKIIWIDIAKNGVKGSARSLRTVVL